MCTYFYEYFVRKSSLAQHAIEDQILKIFWTYYYNWKAKNYFDNSALWNPTILLMSTQSYQMFICISICYQGDKTHNFFNQNSTYTKIVQCIA